jgi:ribonucleoside-diphosphate reductase alpha chain
MSEEIYEFVEYDESEDNENYEYFYEEVIVDDSPPAIALCILSAINVGVIKQLDDLEELCDLAVRALEEIIDYQNYPIKAAELSTKRRRSLGVGYIGLAHYLAKRKAQYSDAEAWKLTHDLSEAFQYYLLKASNNLAKERGACEGFSRTKYSDGILPIDTYKKDFDSIVPNALNYDWEALRQSILDHGLRHSTLSAQMPSESSSVVSNATNGIEPPRGFLSIKKSKKGPLKQIVPQYQSLKNYYTLLWDMPSNEGYINIVAAMQKFFDQSISGNWSYNPTHYENNEVPMSVIINDLLTTYKLGWKTSYYQNSYDYKTDPSELEDEKEEQDSDEEDKPEYKEFEPTLDDDDADCDACSI